jgi:hypothetical protein
MKRMTALARRLKPSRRGPTWLQLGVAMALTLTLAVVSPALGGPSLRSMVRSEVARQIDNLDAATTAKKKKKSKRGPAGPQGPQGAPGANGADGTARAYGQVTPQAVVTCAPNCLVLFEKGIGTVTHIATGEYCVHVPGVSAGQVAAVVSVAFGPTAAPEGNASAQTNVTCDITGFLVETQRISTANATAAPADNVGFTINIP